MGATISSISVIDQYGNTFSDLKGCVGDILTIEITFADTVTHVADTEVWFSPNIFPQMGATFIQGYWKYCGTFDGWDGAYATWYAMRWNPITPATGDFINTSFETNYVRYKQTAATTFKIEWNLTLCRNLPATVGTKAIDIILGQPIVGATNPKDWRYGVAPPNSCYDSSYPLLPFNIRVIPSYLSPTIYVDSPLSFKCQGAWYEDWLLGASAKFNQSSYALTIGGVAATGLSAYDNAVLTFQASHTGLNTACIGQAWILEDNNYSPSSFTDRWEEIIRPTWSPSAVPNISRDTLGGGGAIAIGSSTAPANTSGTIWETQITIDKDYITYGKTYWIIIQYDDSANEASLPFRTTFACGPFVADALPLPCVPYLDGLMEDYNKSTAGNYLPIVTNERFRSTVNVDFCDCSCSEYVYTMDATIAVPAIGDTFQIELPGILGASWNGTDTAGDIDSMLADIQAQIALAYPNGEVYMTYVISSPTTFVMTVYVDECWYLASAGVPINGVEMDYIATGISGGFDINYVHSFFSDATGFPNLGDYRWGLSGVDIVNGMAGDTYTITLPNETGVTVPFNTDISQTMLDMKAALEAAFDPRYVRVGTYLYDPDATPPTVVFLLIWINKCYFYSLYEDDVTTYQIAASSTDPTGWSAPSYAILGTAAATATNPDFSKVIVRVIDENTLAGKTIVLEETVAQRLTVSGGYTWSVTNPRLTVNVLSEFRKYEFIYNSRARYEPSVPELYTYDTSGTIYYNLSNQAWSNPTQNAAATSRTLYLEWSFVSDHTSPTTYSDVVIFKQKLSCKGFDPVVGFVPALPAYGIRAINILDSIGGSPITDFCQGDDVVIEVILKPAVGVNDYNLIAMIEAVPYGIANIQEEETYTGNLTQLSTVRLYDVEADFDNTNPDTAYFKVNTSVLTLGVTYRIHAIAKLDV